MSVVSCVPRRPVRAITSLTPVWTDPASERYERTETRRQVGRTKVGYWLYIWTTDGVTPDIFWTFGSRTETVLCSEGVFPHCPIIVYIPPWAGANAACDIIHETVARLQARHPDVFILISGDFNHVTLTSHLALCSMWQTTPPTAPSPICPSQEVDTRGQWDCFDCMDWDVYKPTVCKKEGIHSWQPKLKQLLV